MPRIHRPFLVLIFFTLAVAGGWWALRSTRLSPPDSPGVPADLSAAASPDGVTASVVRPAPIPRASVDVSSAIAPAKADVSALARLTYAQAWSGELPAAFAAFRDWTGRFLRAANGADRAALETEGIALAAARRAAMKQLIPRDPRAALEATVPAAVRTQLPADVIAELETRFSVVGNYSVMVFDYGPKELIRRKQLGLVTEPFQSFVQLSGSAEYRAYVYGRREGQTTKHDIPLHGVLLDGVVALHESAVRTFELGEIPPAAQTATTVPPAAGTAAAAAPLLAEIGGRFFLFSSPADLLGVEQKFEKAEAGIGPNEIPPIDSVVFGVVPAGKSPATPSSPDQPLPATAWTIGTKNILVIRVDFSDVVGEPKRGTTTYTAAYVENLANTQVAPYYAQSSFGATTLVTTATPQVYRMPQTAATYAVAGNNTQLHTDARAAAAANYTLANYDRIVVLFSFLGTSVIPGSLITYGGLANVGGPNSWINGEWDFRVVAHELGHTWGLYHGNLWQVTDGNPVSTVGTSTEYGDDFDTMGANYANDRRTDFNPWFKNRLGWVADSQVQTITSSGTYRVNRFDNSTGTGILALKITRDATRNYWIGARRAFTTNSSMHHGAYVVWGYNSNHVSDVLDLTTPGTGVTDAALAVGSTLLDTVGNVSIKMVGEGGITPNEYIDVLVTVGLNGLPVISVHPLSQGFNIGDTVALSVTATGTAPMAYQWRKNGNDLTGATTSSYTITNAQAFHAGTYTVQLSNTIATVVSNPATLAVNSAPVIVAQPGHITANAGLTATFSVAVSGYPAATYQWRKAGVNISGAINATYAITNAQSANAGTYDVVVTNTFGVATSSPVSLAVNAVTNPPSNDAFAGAWVLPGVGGVALGSNIGATGETSEPTHYNAGGTASSVWYRWTPTVSGNARVDTIGSSIDTVLAVYTGSILTTLTQLKADDDAGGTGGVSLVTLPVVAGTTYSIAVGSFNTATRGSITLNYLAAAPPAITSQPASVTAAIGGAATFSVGATGTGVVSYQWYHNGIAVAGATAASLTLGNITSADAGSYYCVISTFGGSVATDSVTLAGATAAPTISVHPANATVISGQSTTLGVTATGSGTLSYQWRRNGLAISGATAANYTLPAVTRLDADYYDVLVFAGLTVTPSQVARLSVAPTAYPGLVAPDPAWDIRPESATGGSGYASISLADGRAYIAGLFTVIDGSRRTCVARLNVDGTLDTTFAPAEIDDVVRTLAVQSDGKLIIGGDFLHVGGWPRGRIARLNTDGTVDAAFTAGSGAAATVYAVAVQSDGRILVGGAFFTFNGVSVSPLVRLNSDGSRDAAYAPALNSWVSALTLQPDGLAVIGGWFTYVGGIARNNIARVKVDGTLDTTFGTTTGLNGLVSALALDATGKVIVGGSFTSFSATTVGNVVCLSPDGSLDLAFSTASGAGFNGQVNTLAVQADGKILTGGYFTAYAGASALYLARLNSDGSRDTGYLSSGVNALVNGIAVQASGKVIVAGGFGTYTSAAGESAIRSRFARLNADGSLDTGLSFFLRGPGSIDGLLPVSGGKSIVFGYFTHLRNTGAGVGIARINADGTVDNTFNSGGAGANSNIKAAALQPDGKIIISGFFTTFNNTTANRLARLNADGTLDSSFNAGSGLSSTANTISLLPGGKIFVGGQFATAGGLSRPMVAAFNADGTVDPAFDPGTGANSTVRSSAVQADGRIIIGGSFTTYNGSAANYVARLTAAGALDPTFNTATGASSSVTSVAILPDAKVLIGGPFSSFKSVARSGVARLNADATLDSSFVPPATSWIYSLLPQEDGRVLVRGTFVSVGGGALTYALGRLNTDGTRDTTFGAVGFSVIGSGLGPCTMRDNGQVLMHTSGVAGLAATTAAALPSITTPPLSQTASVGTTVTLSVAATSLLPLSYQWSFNSAPISGAIAATYTLTNVQAANAGNYSVVVTNEVGSTTSATAVLTIGSALAITTQPSAAVVLAGAGASFNVVATGSGVLNYQWQRQASGTTGFSNLSNDSTYAGATTSTLTLASTTVAMRGDQFQCVIGNGSGSSVTTVAVALTVNASPAFTNAAVASFTAGQAGSFTLTATGSPAPTFALNAGTLPVWATLNAATGVLSGTPPNTTGSPFVLTFTASNGISPNANQTFTLTVQPAPVAPTILSQPSAVAVLAGASAGFTVVATGTPAPSYQWQRQAAGTTGFSNLANNATYSGVTTASLSIATANVAMRGDQFQCVVSNGVGSPATSVAVALTVNVAPVFTSPGATSFVVNQAGSFTVGATGTPGPTFSVSAGALPAWATLNATTGVLSGTPPNVTGSPFGLTITASNGVLPAATQVFTLTVVPVAVAPTITTHPVGKVVAVETGTTLSVVATGTGQLTYQWKKDGTDLTDGGGISGATTATLSLANLAVGQSGSYTVVVTNTAGSVPSNPAVLTVVDARVTHGVAGAGYVGGSTVTVTQTLTYSGASTGIGWQMLLPAGWTYASGAGSEGDIKPTVGTDSLLEWAWTALPASPLTFTATLNVPVGTTGDKTITSMAIFRVAAGPAIVLAKPDPLTVSQVTAHSADTDRNNRISLLELTRVIELYNTRNGATRTGAYAVAVVTTEDGFSPEPTRTGASTVTLTRYHSADSSRDGKVSLLELTRVIELYNTRLGTTRTGAYHEQSGTEDGFSPGP